MLFFTGYSAISKKFANILQYALRNPAKSPNAVCTHTMYPPFSVNMVDSSTDMNACGSAQQIATTASVIRVYIGPAAPIASSMPMGPLATAKNATTPMCSADTFLECMMFTGMS